MNLRINDSITLGPPSRKIFMNEQSVGFAELTPDGWRFRQMGRLHMQEPSGYQPCKQLHGKTFKDLELLARAVQEHP